MKLFYNTNGFAFHRLHDVVKIVADLGYDGIALTPDVHHLDPFQSTAADIEQFKRACDAHELSVVIESGARFVLDPNRKHWPTLLDEEMHAAKRVAFLERLIELAANLDAPSVSLWSGSAPEQLTVEAAIDRLVPRLRALCAYATDLGVVLAFEPEPGMAIERIEDWPSIRDAVDHPAFRLTLDVGHCLATREGQPHTWVRQFASDLDVVHLNDHMEGVHDHLMFGHGAIDFDALFDALAEVGYSGPLEVELSRHSSSAPATAAASQAFLRPFLGSS